MKRFVLMAFAATLTSSAYAVVFDFEGFLAGTVMGTQYAPSGMSIVANNFSGPDKAIIFDTANPTGGDTDLRTPGYHPSNTQPLGMVLIIAENDFDGDGDSRVDVPDDEGSQPAGWLRFSFTSTYNEGHVDLLDIEESGGSLQFYKSGSLVQTLSIPKKGDNSYQRISYNGFDYDSVKVNLAGSGAIAEVKAVPEPGSLLALAGGAIFLLRRRRSN